MKREEEGGKGGGRKREEEGGLVTEASLSSPGFLQSANVS